MLWIALGWFALSLGATLWVWGLTPIAFPSPDEAVNRMAALVIQRSGRPFLELPFEDPEDLAHLRAWLSLGTRAIPTYAPVTFYLYSALAGLGRFGYLLIAALPASAAAAYAAGVAQLQPEGRRWLGALAPVLGFPAAYWLLRPWMNISLCLTCVCWAVFYWGCWRRFADRRWLVPALLSVGAAAAVRPDNAPYAFGIALLCAVANEPKEWRRVLVLVGLAGACAVAVNLVLNRCITGHALRFAYQMALETDQRNDFHGPWHVLLNLTFPMGLPSPQDAFDTLRKYWLDMQPLALLAVAQLSLVPLLWKQRGLSRGLYLATLLLVACFLLGRMDKDVHGGLDKVGRAAHSIPRYWSPVYLLAALPPLLFLGRCESRLAHWSGSLYLGLLAALSVQQIYSRQPTSLVYIERFVRTESERVEDVAPLVPANAIVYSRAADKVFWSRWHVGYIGEPIPAVRSMGRALAAGLPVFIWEDQFGSRARREVWRALENERLRAVRVHENRHLFQVVRQES